ncbi:hypothetical protein ACFQ23_07605 [Schaalia naturae]|uniref:Essential protein Yae1 N-terminal domain-containing protein n=1 Tax=Schaalia naturae TaxID=635203 RepID=A0ABW2SNB7_9ACTO
MSETTLFDRLAAMVTPEALNLATHLMNECYDLGRSSIREDLRLGDYESGYSDGLSAGFNDGYAVGYKACLNRMAEAQRHGLRPLSVAEHNRAFEDERGRAA